VRLAFLIDLLLQVRLVVVSLWGNGGRCRSFTDVVPVVGCFEILAPQLLCLLLEHFNVDLDLGSASGGSGRSSRGDCSRGCSSGRRGDRSRGSRSKNSRSSVCSSGGRSNGVRSNGGCGSFVGRSLLQRLCLNFAIASLALGRVDRHLMHLLLEGWSMVGWVGGWDIVRIVAWIGTWIVAWVGTWVGTSGVAAAVQTVLLVNTRSARANTQVRARCRAGIASHSAARSRCRGLGSSTWAAEDAVDASELIGVAIDAAVGLRHRCDDTMMRCCGGDDVRSGVDGVCWMGIRRNVNGRNSVRAWRQSVPVGLRCE
jgi:hypothetical protein